MVGCRFQLDAAVDVDPPPPAAGLVQHEDAEQWTRLSYLHWPTVFAYYNISLSGRYSTIQYIY